MMKKTLPLLKKLISTAGLSGYEASARRLVEEAWRPLTDELRVSRLGSLYGLKRGCGSSVQQKVSSVLLTAHIDAIGLMVTTQVGEFLHVTEIGGLDPRVLPGQAVVVHGREDIPGLLVQPPDHLLPARLKNQPVPIEHLLVDTGLSERALRKLVRPGDVISFAQAPHEMGEKFLAGHSLMIEPR
jgi:endoglucanase